MEKKRFLITILAILALGLLATCGYIVYDKFIKDEPKENENGENVDNTDTTPDSLEEGSFQLDDSSGGGHGTVQVEGYISIVEKKEDDEYWGCGDACRTFSYVFFNILKTQNNDFKSYIQGLSGNTFASENAVGLGCVEDDILWYYNSSDSNERTEYRLSKSDTAKIMSSTKEKPVTLELEKLKLSAGSGVPYCYSHMTTIRIP